MTSPRKPLRLGLLAASRIATEAIVTPAADIDDVVLAAVGARDLGRAEESAQRWGIGAAYGSYDELIADPAIDAIYIATPSSLHRPWTVRALEAGKHVLVEKPLAANAADAQLIADAAGAHPELVCMEAFHWRYHPLSVAWLNIAASGRLGRIRSVIGRFNTALDDIPRGDIRWDLSLGGGATMDLGCYPIQWVRAVGEVTGAGEPTVTSALTTEPEPEIDGRLTAALTWTGGMTGMIESSMVESGTERVFDLRVVGDAGEMYVWNPLAPHRGGRIEVTIGATTETTTVDQIDGGAQSTYYYQLLAFRDAVTTGAAFATTMASGVENMRIIDECYRAAGLVVRPTAD